MAPRKVRGMAPALDTSYQTLSGTIIKIELQESADKAGSPSTLMATFRLQGTANTSPESHAFNVRDDKYSSELTKIETPEFPHLSGAPSFWLSERYKLFDLKVGGGKPRSIAGADLVPEGNVYLFNVIVALEWQPSWRTIDTLMHAFRGASDVLYDATNGGMAFGQVVFAGPEYLNRADIQILASNRFHPRSMVNGLTDPSKYSPIRLGRGIWRKDRHILLPWDDVISYRAIAHEWAHYALGLRDEYIDDTLRVRRQGNRLVEDPSWGAPIVVPRVLISLQTLMETLEADELVPLQHRLPAGLKGKTDEIGKLRERVVNKIEERYSGLETKLFDNNPGPSGFPVPLPRFFRMPGFEIPDLEEEENIPGTEPPKQKVITEEVICNIDKLQLDHCWLYSLRWDKHQLHIIAQGRLDERAKSVRRIADPPRDGFELLGAKEDDTLLAVGLILPEQLPGTPRPMGTPAVQRASVSGEVWKAQDLPATPVIAVVPSVVPSKQQLQWPDMKVQVRVTDGSLLGNIKVWLASPGVDAAKQLEPKIYQRLYEGKEEEYQKIEHMDGIIALQWGEFPDLNLWVAEFSYGGNPPTSVLSPGAPINAGSSDGNLMIFSALDDNMVDNEELKKPFYNKPIVTTRNYAGFEAANFVDVDGLEAKRGRPAGYLFSVASGEKVDTIHQKPTIVMYYDGEALDDGRDLVIHRYDGKNWRALPTYLPGGSAYAATPINEATAPSLVAESQPPDGRVEYYRLFSIPR